METKVWVKLQSKLEMRKKDRKSILALCSEDLVTTWLWSFIASGYSWAFPACCFHKSSFTKVLTAPWVPLFLLDTRSVLHVGRWGQAPWPARLHSLLWPHYHSEALLANLLVRLVQLGIAWPHWPGAAPPDQISCLVLTKGCQAGWVQKTRVANFTRKQVGPRRVTTTVLCIVWASRLLRNQRRLEKRVGKIAQITVLLWPLLHLSDL